MLARLWVQNMDLFWGSLLIFKKVKCKDLIEEERVQIITLHDAGLFSHFYVSAKFVEQSCLGQES